MADGATAENANTMLHFLIPENPEGGGSPRSVTMVCDAPSEEMRAFVDGLTAGLRDSRRTVTTPDRD